MNLISETKDKDSGQVFSGAESKDTARIASREVFWLVNDVSGRLEILRILVQGCSFAVNLEFLSNYSKPKVVFMYPMARFKFVKVKLSTGKFYYVLEEIDDPSPSNAGGVCVKKKRFDVVDREAWLLKRLKGMSNSR